MSDINLVTCERDNYRAMLEKIYGYWNEDSGDQWYRARFHCMDEVRELLGRKEDG